MALHEGQWKFVLAPGVTPASEEAVEWFTSAARTEQYEMAATVIMEEWPVLTYEPDTTVVTKVKAPEAASWTSRDEVHHITTAKDDGDDQSLIPF